MMARKTRLATAAVAAAIVASSGGFGCGLSEVQRGKLAGIEAILTQARHNGAQRCAPKELAAGEKHVAQAKEALIGGAEDLALAEQEAKLAYEKSPPERCREAQVGPNKGVASPASSQSETRPLGEPVQGDK